jgi:periplasmic divalent cation tolerance protein
MANALLLVLTSFPDADSARTVSNALVEERLVACANIIPGIQSVYRWKGRVESVGEAFVIMKTNSERSDELWHRLKALHPYDVPEIIRIDADAALSTYLDWVGDCCKKEK